MPGDDADLDTEILQDPTWDDVPDDWPECKSCESPSVTLLHGRFPLCQEHYREVIESGR